MTAHSQVIEVSVHQGPVEAPPAIDAGHALTMDKLVPAPQCATLITCVHAPPLTSTSNQLLLAHSTRATAPLLVPGPSFLAETQAPISMLPGTHIVFSGALGALGAPGALQSSVEFGGAVGRCKSGPVWPHPRLC